MCPRFLVCPSRGVRARILERGRDARAPETIRAPDGTSSAAMRAQVSRARQAQRARFGPEGHRWNGRMGSRQLRKFCALDEEGKGLLGQAMDELEGSADIRPGRLVEAIGYRSLDRKLWAT